LNNVVIKRIITNAINYINESKELLASKKIKFTESEDDNYGLIHEQPKIIFEGNIILMHDVIMTYNYLEAYII